MAANHKKAIARRRSADPGGDDVPYLIKTSMGDNTLMIGTDYGLGGRFHPQIAWAKLRALRDGAAIASKKLWS